MESFGATMGHQFDVVNTQVENGITSIKRFVQYLEKIVQHNEKYAGNVIKTTETELVKAKQIKDCMQSHLHSAFEFEKLIYGMAKKHQLFAANIRSDVMGPLSEIARNSEVQRKKKAEAYAKLMGLINNRTAELAKDRAYCIKQHKKLCDILKEKLEEEHKGPENKKAIQKATKIYDKQYAKSIKVFQEYEQGQIRYVNFYTDAVQKIIPEMLQEFEKLEVIRLKGMKTNFQKLIRLQNEFGMAHPNLQTCMDSVKELDYSTAIQKTIKDWQSVHGQPTPIVVETSLPCSSEEIKSNSWKQPQPQLNTRIERLGSQGEEKKKMVIVKALFDFDGDPEAEDHEITFGVDDYIRVLHRGFDDEESDDENGWWLGYNITLGPDDVGVFPNNYVKRVIDPKEIASVQSGGLVQSAFSKPIDEEDIKLNQLEKDQTKEDKNKKNKTFADLIRGKVSKKKKRFKKDGYDLDLSYVTDNIIAMGLPSEGVTAGYRNPLPEVQRFMNSRHPRRYKLYNLCSEHKYDAMKFEGRVERYPFDDHNPCQFEMIDPFCRDVHQWLNEHPDNIAAIHCKAGKGRTGFLIACYLMYCGLEPSSQKALDFFAKMRTQNRKGVTIPSQIRYVRYYDKLLRIRRVGSTEPPIENPVYLTKVVISTIPKACKNKNTDVWFVIQAPDFNYSSKGLIAPARYKKDNLNPEDTIVFTTRNINSITALTKDCRIQFYHATAFGGKDKLFQCWFNVRFLDTTKSTQSLILEKMELDKACKDTKDKSYSKALKIELVLQKKD